MERSPRRWLSLPAWLAGAGVGLLLLVVAAVATDVPGRRPPSRLFSLDVRALAEMSAPVIRLVLLMLAVGAFYWWLYTRSPSRRSRGRRRRVSPLAVLLALVIVAAFSLLVLPELLDTEATTSPSTSMLGTPTPGTPAPAEGGESSTAVDDPGFGVWVLIALAIGAAGYAYLSRRRNVGPIPAPSRRREEAPVTPPSEPATDPSGRVFAAYLRVQEAAQLRHVGRSPAETVGSHLGRLGGITESGPADELAEIYHRARFSNRLPDAAEAGVAEADGRQIVARLQD